MQGWPGYLPSNGEGMDADAKITLERTILAHVAADGPDAGPFRAAHRAPRGTPPDRA